MLFAATFARLRAAWLRRVRAIPRADDGTASVTFILTLPIFLTIIGVIVQLALLWNAKVVLDHAAQAAARSALTSLPDGHPENPLRAACLVLAPLSPQSKTAAPDEAIQVHQALLAMGVPVAPSFPARYAYAMEVTKVDWPRAIDYEHASTRDVEVTVTYRFLLTVPGVSTFIAPVREEVSGVQGRYVTLHSTVRLQTAHARESASNSEGWPYDGQGLQ